MVPAVRKKAVTEPSVKSGKAGKFPPVRALDKPLQICYDKKEYRKGCDGEKVPPHRTSESRRMLRGGVQGMDALAPELPR